MATSAHEGLSKVYGTSDALNKLALGGGYVGALFGALAGKSAWEDQEENRREGERVTHEIRAELARRNAPINEGFRTGSFTTTRSYDFDAQPIARQGNLSPQKGASSAFPYHLVVITVGELDSLDLEGFLPLNSSGIFPSTL